MGTSATKSKLRWNSAHYTQVKAYVAPDIASAFKAACLASGSSMSSELAIFMTNYCQMQQKHTRATDFLSTKAKRHRAHEELLRKLILLRDAQEQANNNVPDNFQDTDGFEVAVEIVNKMDDAIEILESIY
jgi:hypothetical protein